MAYFGEKEQGTLKRSPLLNSFLDLNTPKEDPNVWTDGLFELSRPYRQSLVGLLSHPGYLALVNGFANLSLAMELFAPQVPDRIVGNQVEILFSMGFEVGDPQDCIPFNRQIVLQLASARILNPYMVAGKAETFGQGSAVLSSMVYTGAQLKYGVDHHYSSHRVVQEGYPELSLFRGVVEDLEGFDDLGKGQT